jgi:hypothetical protein
MLTRLFISVFCLSLLSACSTVNKEKQDADYVAYLSAQREHASAHKQEVQLVRIVAQPGATITMSGVSEFSVFMPAAPIAMPQQKINQPSELVQVIDRVMPIVGVIGGVLAGGYASKALATAVGKSATEGYSHIQAPATPAPSYNISGGVTTIGSGSASTTNGSGIVGSGTQTVSGGSVMGSGTVLSGTGTTGSGGYSSTAMSNSTGVLGSGVYNVLSGTGTTGSGSYTPITSSYNPTDNHADNHAVTNPVK